MQACLIIGASDGLGKSIAKSLVDQNYSRLDLLGKKLSKLKKLKKELELKKKCLIRIYPVDLSQSYQVEIFLNNYLKENKALDLLVLVAAQLNTGSFLDTSYSAILKDFQVNLLSQIRITQRITNLLKVNKGRIAPVHSLACQIPHPQLLGYSASKSAFQQAMNILEVELENLGITFTHIYPPGMNTNLTKRIATPSWISQYLQKEPEQVSKAICKAILKKKRAYYGSFFQHLIGHIFWFLPNKIRRFISKKINDAIKSNI